MSRAVSALNMTAYSALFVDDMTVVEVMAFNSLDSNGGIYNLRRDIADCKLFCSKRSLLLQLQCMGTSETMAILTWFMVIVLVVCAIIQLMSVWLERGARKLSMVGGPLFLAFVDLAVYLVSTNRPVTPFYSIAGAMNVAVFSSYFSSFQYNISLLRKLATATAPIFTMFPIWRIRLEDIH